MQTTSTDTYPIPTEEELKKIIESQCQKIANLGKSLDEQDHKCEFQHEKYSFLEASIDSIKREASCIKMNNVKYRRRMNKLISKSKPPPDYTLKKLLEQGQPPPKYNWVAQGGHKLKSAVSNMIDSHHNKPTANSQVKT